VNILKAIGVVLSCAILCAATAAAQGSRKDDVVFGPTGRPMAGVSVAICTEPATTTTAPCSPLATLYSNAALSTPLANPLATDGLGNYFFYAAPGKYTIQIYGPGITTRILPDVILPSDPSSPTFTSVTTTSGISAFSLSLAGNLAVSGNVSVAGTLTVDGNPITGGGGGGSGASLSANNIFTGNDSFKGPIPYWDWQAWGASGSSTATTASSSISASSTTIPLTAAIDFADGEGIAINGAGATTSLATPTGAATIVQGSAGSTSHTYQIAACDALRGCSPVESTTITTAPSTLTPKNYVQGAVNPESGTAFFAIYKDGSPWDTFSAEASPPYIIGGVAGSNIARTGGSSVTVTVNQYCPECNYAIVGSQITVSGTTNFNGTFTVTSITYVSGAIVQLNWTSSGPNVTETAGTISQPIPWFDRGAGALAQWPSNVPTTPPSSATAERYIGGISSGAGTTTLTVSPATSTAVASGAAIQHDDTAAANAADAACVAANGGLIYVPHGSYNIFGALTFSGAEGSPCTLDVIGNVYVANTSVVNQGWAIEGIGGGNLILSYAQAPNAGWSPMEYGAGTYPVWLSVGGTVTLQNLYGGSTNGAYFEAGPYSTENHLNNLQVKMNATGFEGGSGALVKFEDACCSNWVTGGSYTGNNQAGPRGVDDPISFEGWNGANTPSDLDYVNGPRLYNGGILLRGETSSTGANMNMVHVSNVLMEAAPTAEIDVDSRDEAYDVIELDSDSVSDSAASNIPFINIVGYYAPIDHVVINAADEGGDGLSPFVGSSIMSPFGANPCVSGLTILNGPDNGQIFQGTATSCGFASSLGLAGFAASRVTATDNQAANAGQQGGSLNVGLAAPANCVATPATSGGSLADGTYTYIMTALNGLDVPTTSTPYESWWSPLATATVTGGGGHGEVSVACAASAGAASYKLYGRAGGAAGVTGYIANSSATIVDTGASLTAGSLPNSGGEAGNASVVRFTATGNHYIIQGNTGFGTAAPQHVVDAAGDFIRGQGGFINGGHMNQSAANSDFAGSSACASGAKTITFASAYSSTPVILIFDETTSGGVSLSAKSASSFAVICTGTSDAFDYIVVGNPN
jgi:hypothetical protein